MEYKAAGFASGGADKLAPLVDGVLAEQMQRFAAFASRTPPLGALQGHEAERRLAARRRMLLAGNLLPAAERARVVDEGVAVDVGQHLGQLDPVGERQEQGEQVRRRRSPTTARRRPRPAPASRSWTTSTPGADQCGRG